MKPLLNIQKGSLALRVQELFFEYFYSPRVWRKNSETMALYIVHRELAFSKLKEATQRPLSDNLKCMLLLLFSVDLKANSEYDYKRSLTCPSDPVSQCAIDWSSARITLVLAVDLGNNS